MERRVLLSGGLTRNFNRFRALNTLAATNALTYRRAQATTWQGGIVGKVSSDVSLFGGYNESFQPNNNLDTAGRQLPNLEGKQTEIGVKAKLWQDRVRVTAAWFDIKASTSRAAFCGAEFRPSIGHTSTWLAVAAVRVRVVQLPQW